MTQWGGVEVSRFALGAGFIGPDNDAAVQLAYAASKWSDHYESPHVSDPTATRYGLWGLTQQETGIDNPRALLDPRTSALYLNRLFNAAGRSFDWHHGIQAEDGALFERAGKYIDTLRLKGRTAHAMPPVGHVIGSNVPLPSIATIMDSAPHLGYLE